MNQIEQVRTAAVSFWNLTIMGVSIYHIVFWFFAYSFLGWIWETSFCSIKARKYINRGFVFGPCVTIYGGGAIIVYLLLRRFADQPVLIYIVGALLASTLEYLTSLVMEQIYHARWWDYSNQKFNLQGRICLKVSLGWGVMCLAMFWVLQPVVEFVTDWIPENIGRYVLYVIIITYLVDNIMASVAAGKVAKKLKELDDKLAEIEQRYSGRFVNSAVQSIQKTLDVLDTKVNSAQDTISQKRSNMDEKVGESLEDYVMSIRNSTKGEEFMVAYEKFKEAWMHQQNARTNRFLTSYPDLSKGIVSRKDALVKRLSVRKTQ